MARYTVKAIQAIAEVEGLQLEKLKNGYSIGSNFVSTLAEAKDWIDGYVEQKQLATTEASDEIEENPNVQGTEDIQTTTDRLSIAQTQHQQETSNIISKPASVSDLTEVAVKDIAKEVKDRLKRNFPETTFKVTSDHNSLDIVWSDGPIEDTVAKIADRFCGYEYYNDGHNDSYRLREIKFKGKPSKTYLQYLHYSRRLSQSHYTTCLKLAAEQGIDTTGLTVSDRGIEGDWSERNSKVMKLARSLAAWQAIGDRVTLEQISGFIRLIKWGEVTADRIREVWSVFRASEASIKQALESLTKKDLKQYCGGYVYNDSKKEQLIHYAFTGLADDFIPNGCYSWTPSQETQLDVIAKVVATLTDEQIQERAQKIRQNTQEWIKTHTNPETLEELDTFVRYHGIEKLTQEQLVKYDELLAADGRSRRMEDKARSLTISEMRVPEGVTLTMIETKHTRNGYELWVVQLSDRVDGNIYKALLNRANALSGWYSSYAKNGAVPGFQFKEQAKAEEFISLSRIDGKERLEAREEKRKENAIAHLSIVAENLKESAESVLTAERKTNTARRVNIAEYMEANARSSIQLAETTLNLADALSTGTLQAVSRARFLTDTEELDTQLSRAMRAAEHSNPQGDWQRSPIEPDINHVTYPWPFARKSRLLSIVEVVRDHAGLKFIAKRLTKLCNESEDPDYVWFKCASDIEQLTDFLNRAKSVNGVYAWDLETIRSCMQSYKRLIRLDIHNEVELRVALREYLKLKAERLQADPLKQAERNIIGIKIPGFVPTPKPTVDKMLEKADIQPRMDVLEPSAGSGHIADEIRKIEGVSLTVVERSVTLRELLEKKGYTLAGDDSLQHVGCYDRILLNPAWEDGHDIDEIQHCYINCLKAGGRMVAIASSGSTSRQDKKARDFQNWLKGINASGETLPDDAFVESGYNVRGVLIVIDKPETTSNVISADDSEALQETTAQSEPESIPVTPRKLNKQVKAYEPALINYLEQQAKNGDTDAIALLEAITDPIVPKIKRQSSSRTTAPKVKTNARLSTRSLSSETAKQEKWHRLEAVDRAIQTGTSAKIAAKQQGLPGSSIAAELAGYRLATKYPDLFELWQTDITTWSNIRSAAQSFKSLGEDLGLAVARGTVSLKEAKSQV